MVSPAPFPRPLRLLGHDEPWHAVLAALDAGRMHHAWLLDGPTGIGKTSFALELAALLLAGPDSAARAAILDRAREAAHPDLLVVARGTDDRNRRRAEIRVDDARPVAGFLRRTAAEAGWRAVVVEDAEFLNRNAANALLKILEEPPPRCAILLSCAVPGRLPATLRSRCRRLPFAPLAPPAMAAALARLLPDTPAPERDRLAGAAAGSPGRALFLHGEASAALRQLAEELAAAGSPPADRLDAIADAVLRHENGTPVFLGLLADAISGRARAAIRRGEAVPAAAIDGYEVLGRLRRDTERFTLEPRQALFSGLSQLHHPGTASP
ncbi:MAG: DNA polymerase III subunit delta' [Gluconacetobacter diazotrophicus]|nr:DNA polymerase III subunit delta' [Gluconacetobacter diazotrophicus]